MSFCIMRKDRKEVVTAIKPIYQAPTTEAALEALAAFEAGPWGQKIPRHRPAWRGNGSR